MRYLILIWYLVIAEVEAEKIITVSAKECDGERSELRVSECAVCFHQDYPAGNGSAADHSSHRVLLLSRSVT